MASREGPLSMSAGRQSSQRSPLSGRRGPLSGWRVLNRLEGPWEVQRPLGSSKGPCEVQRAPVQVGGSPGWVRRALNMPNEPLASTEGPQALGRSEGPLGRSEGP